MISPIEDKPTLEFFLPLTNGEQNFILNSIKLFAEDCELIDVKTKVLSMIKTTHLTNYEEMASLFHCFNVMALAKNNQKSPATPKFLEHIIQCSIDHANVAATQKSLQAFSEQTYGQISFELMQNVCNRMNVNPESTYIDLGSGIGTTVLQMAGAMQLKKCIGIEIRKDLFEGAKKVYECFHELMAWFGKHHSDIELLEGDFTGDAMRDIVFGPTITHYLVNNLLMGPKINNYLLENFMKRPNGTVIITSLQFGRKKKFKSKK